MKGLPNLYYFHLPGPPQVALTLGHARIPKVLSQCQIEFGTLFRSAIVQKWRSGCRRRPCLDLTRLEVLAFQPAPPCRPPPYLSTVWAEAQELSGHILRSAPKMPICFRVVYVINLDRYAIWFFMTYIFVIMKIYLCSNLRLELVFLIKQDCMPR